MGKVTSARVDGGGGGHRLAENVEMSSKSKQQNWLMGWDMRCEQRKSQGCF